MELWNKNENKIRMHKRNKFRTKIYEMFTLPQMLLLQCCDDWSGEDRCSVACRG